MAKLAPKPKNDSPAATNAKSPKDVERLADAFINGGGKAIPITPELEKGFRPSKSNQTDPDALIGITIKMLVQERNQINEARAERQKKNIRDKISIESWILEAVNEKLKRELKYKK